MHVFLFWEPLPITANENHKDELTSQHRPPPAKRGLLIRALERMEGSCSGAPSAVQGLEQKGKDTRKAAEVAPYMGKSIRLRRKSQVQVPALPATQCVTCDKSVLAS